MARKEKRFLSYQEQVEYLNAKGVSCYGKEEMVLIRRLGYFNLVSGYKWPFISGVDEEGSYIYVKGTSVEQMGRVKVFDDELRMLLLRYITKAEDEIRAIAAYKLDDVNLEVVGEVVMWSDSRAYEFGKSSKEVKRLIGRMEREMSISRVSYLREFKRKYEKIPTWLLFKFVSFASFINVLSYAKAQVREELCGLYGVCDHNGVIDSELLINSLHWLRKVRNVCAHNERVYDTHDKSRVIERYFGFLPSDYASDLSYKRIIDILVYLKYFLDANDYSGLIGQVKAMLIRLKEEILPYSFDRIVHDMGILAIDDLEFLLREKKVTNYLGI